MATRFTLRRARRCCSRPPRPPSSPRRVVAFEPVPGGFDPKKTYRLRTEWRAGRVTLAVDGVVFATFDGPKDDPVDRFRHAHLGGDPQFQGATPGPVYSNLRVTAHGR